ncbi:MAG: protein yceI precursor, partial [Acidobacteria bacterium]|nr:protein yceI precursor [Acidobacteriota bacterium]
FGVSWNDVVEGGGLMVGNEVDINLSIEAIRQKAAQPGATSGR